ncbi:M48 family metalloprotease [Tsukamurella sp. 8F]|uniref:M48 family metallopeptidase n=1 Tax=unclassified Tsukamurella TaxID=2633480 RepID=UPI0023B8EF22|nr:MULTISPECIES: M48 family metalloprotease [unclassified Tsukamurella]MDF0529689.1 M48 family metalloprotease [Tsukamurella sp. 8J]MDF0585974.1 M48 family metalloprotease [Tsukamurella sp. 8F]
MHSSGEPQYPANPSGPAPEYPGPQGPPVYRSPSGAGSQGGADAPAPSSGYPGPTYPQVPGPTYSQGPGPTYPQGPGPIYPQGPGPAPAYSGPPRRHPAEIPLLVLVILCTVGVYVTAISAVALGHLTGIGQYALIALILPFVVWLGRGTTWASPRVNGIQMTPTQFPEGYAIVREAAQRYGLREVPDAFVVLGNGQINAFASGHGFRRYVVVYSDLFEIGGAARDPEALRFIVGHEVGHIAAGHVSYWRQLGSVAMQYLPVIGSALSRSQEYTADNYGYFNQPSGVPGAIGTLGAGKYLNVEVDFDLVADRASTDKGFFTWLANLTASHPVLTWRAEALRNRTRAGAVFFPPAQPTRGIGGGAAVPAGQVPNHSKQEVLAPPPGGGA